MISLLGLVIDEPFVHLRDHSRLLRPSSNGTPALRHSRRSSSMLVSA